MSYLEASTSAIGRKVIVWLSRPGVLQLERRAPYYDLRTPGDVYDWPQAYIRPPFLIFCVTSPYRHLRDLDGVKRVPRAYD